MSNILLILIVNHVILSYIPLSSNENYASLFLFRLGGTDVKIMQKRKCKKSDSAVSPVVGVMLMLVVTIIIAAVVSMFAGGLIGGAESAPSMTMDVAIMNTGSYATSYFQAKILSVSEPIPTNDLKLVTSWINATGVVQTTTLIANQNSANPLAGYVGSATGLRWSHLTAPFGAGNGVQEMNSGVPSKQSQQFGNYTLIGGTVMYAYPAGQAGGFAGESAAAPGYGYGIATKYTYGAEWLADGYLDGMQQILGSSWNELRTGDIVNVKLIHIPSGMTMFEKDVVVS